MNLLKLITGKITGDSQIDENKLIKQKVTY